MATLIFSENQRFSQEMVAIVKSPPSKTKFDIRGKKLCYFGLDNYDEERKNSFKYSYQKVS